MRTAKHDLMRYTNTLSVLECIRQYGQVTKREIQEKTGLSWGAVSNIVGELLNKNVISETPSTDPIIGRTPLKYDIRSDNNLIIGVDINIEGLTAVLIDLKCRVLREIRAVVTRNDRESVLAQVKKMIHGLIKESKVDKERIIGIGIAMQGAVDAEKGISIFSPYFDGWENVPVSEILEQEFHIPVCVEHDPNCMALTEKWLGSTKDVNNFLFIRLSMGIGMSIIMNGEIYKGVDGSASEFGHITMNPGGARCTCGNYGCLEVYSSGRSLLRQVGEGIKLGRAPLAAELAKQDAKLDLGVAIAAAKQGDVFVRGLFDDAAVYLGIGISNLINIFNPDMIIIGGELAKYEDLYLDRVREIAGQKAWKNFRVNIVTSKFGSNSAAIGAAAVFIQKVFSGDIKEILV